MSLIKLNMSEHVGNCAMKCFLVESLTFNWPVGGKCAVDGLNKYSWYFREGKVPAHCGD